MNIARSSLRSFLESAKTTLQNAITNQQHIFIVIGNESADLDSITSAILLAYLRSNSSSPRNQNSSNPGPSSVYIPVLNVPFADVKIRPELLKLLPYANLEPRHLITLDDLGFASNDSVNGAGKQLQARNTSLLLTDHNKIAGPLAGHGFDDAVIGCIDHHVDEHGVRRETGDEPRILSTAGSCTSLIVQHCRQVWDALSATASSVGQTSSAQDDASVGGDDAAVRRTWDAQIAKLAIASVLIDTSGLRDKNKTEEVDRQAVDYLEAKILLAPGASGTKWDREAFLKDINAAKKDLSNLSLDEFLRKDYKKWTPKGTQLGVSAVVKPLTWQISRAGGPTEFGKGVEAFASERGLDVCCIGTTSTSEEGEFRRELLVWSTAAQHDHLVDGFEEKSTEELRLERWEECSQEDLRGGRMGKLRIWWQREVKYSRKQVAPLLRAAMEGP